MARRTRYAEDMRIDFAQSERSTIGVEWEVVVVDRETRAPVPRADELADALEGTPEHRRLSKELLRNTVEIVTGVHHRVEGALAEIDDVAQALRRQADRRDLGILCAGTHPFAKACEQEYTHNERYQKLIDRTQWWGRLMSIYGLHVHVGIDSVDKAMPMLNALLYYLPHLQALSASSPWWEGVNTGYASNRAMMFRQLPTAGLPVQYPDWSGFEEYATGALKTGVIEDLNEIRWDVRPAPRFGTLESRIADGVPTLLEIGALTAFTQCAVDDLNQRLSDGETFDALPAWVVRENKWRAGRYGLPTVFIADSDLNERSVVEDTWRLLEQWKPVARRLGCERQLADVETIIRGGASYQRQLRVASRNNDDLTTVVDALVAEFDAGVPLP